LTFKRKGWEILKKKKIDNLLRKFTFSIFGFLAGLVLLLTGFLMAIYKFPEKIWFLGLAMLIPGVILVIRGGRYYIGADKEIKNKKIKQGRMK